MDDLMDYGNGIMMTGLYLGKKNISRDSVTGHILNIHQPEK